MDDLKELHKKFVEFDEEKRIETLLSIKQKPITTGFLTLLKHGLSDQSWRVRKTALDIVLSRKDNNRIQQILMDGLRSHDNAGLRNTATEGLILMGRKAFPLLKKNINDPDTDVRKIIIDILGEIKSKDVLDIVTKFLKDKDENVRSAAAEAIGKIGDRKGIQVLLKTLKGNDNYLKFTALESLGSLGEVYGIKDIKLIIECLNNSLLGRAAYDALGRSKNKGAIPYLVKGLEDLRRSHREAALIGIMNLYNSLKVEDRKILVEALKKGLNEHIKDELIKSLRSFTVKIKIASASLLSWLKIKEALPYMIELLKDETLAENISECISAFSSEATLELIEIMKKSDEYIISNLCNVLGKIGDPRAEDYLIELLPNNSDEVRISAASALGKVGTTKSIAELFKLFTDSDRNIQNAAKNALKDLSVRHREEIKQYALLALSSTDEAVRENAFYILGVAGDKGVLESINLGLKDARPEIRQASAEALGMLGFEDSIEPLSYALTDEDPRVRLASVKSLSRIRSTKILNALKIGLKDEHVWVRVSAVKALSQFDFKAIKEYLETALLDPAPPVVMAALEIYRSMKIAVYLNALSQVMLHKNIEVVRECLRIIKDMNTKNAIGVLPHGLRNSVPEIRLEIARFIYENFPKDGKKILRKMALEEKDEKVKSYLDNLK